MQPRKAVESLARWLLRPLGYSVVPINIGYLIAADWRLDELHHPGHDDQFYPIILRDMAFANHLRALFGHLDVDCVLDVGANEGQYGLFLREHVGFAGQILSFEPASESYARLLSTVGRDANWKAFRLALGREDTVRAMNIMRVSQLNSFLEPSADLSGHLREVSAVERSEPVDVRRVSELLPQLKAEFNFKRPYLKLDTQGFDLEVIAGAGSKLTEFVAMQSEMSVQPVYRDMPSYRDALRILEGLGYDISGLFWVSVVDHRMFEFDCVMVRRNSP